MYEIKVTVEVPGLPEALTALADALGKRTETGCHRCSTQTDEVMEVEAAAAANPTAPAQAASTTVTAAPTPAQPTAPTTAAPTASAVRAETYTLDALSRAGAALIDQGKMPQLLELLKKYGVQAVTQLDPGTYPAFVEEMKALGAKL
nr:MAG TPA: hypothetical protein [Caudoviricetes sp.]